MAAPDDLSWDDYRLVHEIAEAGGMTGAAAALGINHSTVFRRLGQIEAALGVTLFERHRTGYALTPAGEEMVAVAGRMDAGIAAFTRKLAGQELTPEGELRVTTSDSLLLYLFTPIFAVFRTAYPKVRLDIVVGNQALNLSRRDADVAIRATGAPPGTLVGRRAAHIAWALYGRRADFGAGGDAIAAAVETHTWVGLGDSFTGLKVVEAERRLIAPERIAYRLNSVMGLAEAIEAGIGIGHLPCFVGDARPDLMRLGPLMPDYAADLWLLTHPDLRHSPRVRAFMDVVSAEIRRRRAFIEGEDAGRLVPAANAASPSGA